MQRMEGFLSILLSFAALDFEMQPVLCVCERRKGEDLVRIRMQMYHFPQKIIQSTLKLPFNLNWLTEISIDLQIKN